MKTPLEPYRSKVSRRPAFADPAIDERPQLLMNRLIHRRFLVIRHNFFVFGRGPLSRPNTTGQFPSFVIAPIADEGLVEGGFVTVLGMLNPEKMPR